MYSDLNLAFHPGDLPGIHSFLAELTNQRRKSTTPDAEVEQTTQAQAAHALHLAVKCGSCTIRSDLIDNCGLTDTPAFPFSGDIIAILLANRFISPNAVYPPESKTTPLHLAASEGRVDVVNLLLDQEGIDDALLDANCKSCKDVAKGKDVVKAIQGTRSPESFQGTPRNETSIGYRRPFPFRLSIVSRCLIPFTPPILHPLSFTSDAQLSQP